MEEELKKSEKALEKSSEVGNYENYEVEMKIKERDAFASKREKQILEEDTKLKG